jgi:osmotically-inducible protein OsmY
MTLFPSALRRGYALALPAAYCALWLLAAGCFHAHPKQIGGHRLDDRVITERVEAALKARRGFTGVRVATSAGIVTLSGSVDRPEYAAEAARLARSVDQVKEVRNRLVTGTANGP